ncbi:hypothetical protein BDM02DRAFT_3113268 [Thelephora ganbajun]|uniref:Uncharacterized protein n=1 Tax=Thelephora ganbajun TaxID=370292 RepID=A0ACB6ZJR3_THEGA|nr:hypothetical protein BDM02DRAFT_3113268 [Thelephora ganbajun]
MPPRNTGGGSRLSISERDGNISSIPIFGDRPAAVGASYGGYAIKYFASIPRDRD